MSSSMQLLQPDKGEARQRTLTKIAAWRKQLGKARTKCKTGQDGMDDSSGFQKDADCRRAEQADELRQEKTNSATDKAEQGTYASASSATRPPVSRAQSWAHRLRPSRPRPPPGNETAPARLPATRDAQFSGSRLSASHASPALSSMTPFPEIPFSSPASSSEPTDPTNASEVLFISRTSSAPTANPLKSQVECEHSVHPFLASPTSPSRPRLRVLPSSPRSRQLSSPTSPSSPLSHPSTPPTSRYDSDSPAPHPSIFETFKSTPSGSHSFRDGVRRPVSFTDKGKGDRQEPHLAHTERLIPPQLTLPPLPVSDSFLPSSSSSSLLPSRFTRSKTSITDFAALSFSPHTSSGLGANSHHLSRINRDPDSLIRILHPGASRSSIDVYVDKEDESGVDPEAPVWPPPGLSSRFSDWTPTPSATPVEEESTEEGEGQPEEDNKLQLAGAASFVKSLGQRGVNTAPEVLSRELVQELPTLFANGRRKESKAAAGEESAREEAKMKTTRAYRATFPPPSLADVLERRLVEDSLTWWWEDKEAQAVSGELESTGREKTAVVG
ncbi:hypothetical protein JCM11641_007756 [Rhodosporidiobolus odoratus]